MHQDIFENADRRLAGEKCFLYHPHDDPRRWPHLKKLRLAWASAKSSTPKSKLAPKKDRPLYQIKLARRDNKRISLSKLLTISSCKQKKKNRSLFKGTMAAGPPLDGGKGFPSSWTTATEQPKIDVGTQRAQTRQKKKLTWGTKGGNSFGNLALKDARGVKKNCLKPRSGYQFPQGTVQPPSTTMAAPLDVVGVLNQLSMLREIKLAREKLIPMEIQMVSAATALQKLTQKTDLLISLFHSMSHSLDTSKSVLLSAILDPPAVLTMPREKGYPLLIGPVRQNNAARTISCYVRRCMTSKNLRKINAARAIQRRVRKIRRAKIFRPCCRTITACIIQQQFCCSKILDRCRKILASYVITRCVKEVRRVTRIQRRAASRFRFYVPYKAVSIEFCRLGLEFGGCDLSPQMERLEET